MLGTLRYMFELLLILIIVGLLFRRRDKRKKSRSIDAELHKMIEDVRESEITATEIRQFLLDIINDNKQDVEKFSDVRLPLLHRHLSQFH